MIWVGWRQQRAEAAIVAAMLAALAAVLLPTGLNVASAFDAGHLSSCTGATTSQSCQQAVGQFLLRFNGLGGLIAWLTLIPGLVGTVLAAPLLVSLEQGTQRLDWTQSITRRRWLVTKLGLAAAAAVVAAGVLVLLVTWWRMPFTRLEGRMDNSVFDSEGTVVLAYTLFALALCTLVGVLWRRAVPALMVGFAGYVAVRVLFDTVVRQHLLTPAAVDVARRRRAAGQCLARLGAGPVPERPPRPPGADRHDVRPRARRRHQLPAHARRLHARRLPPRQPLLGPAGNRDRDLRRAGARHARVLGVVGARAGDLEVQRCSSTFAFPLRAAVRHSQAWHSGRQALRPPTVTATLASRQPSGGPAVACAKKRQIASVASGPRGSV